MIFNPDLTIARYRLILRIAKHEAVMKAVTTFYRQLDWTPALSALTPIPAMSGSGSNSVAHFSQEEFIVRNKHKCRIIGRRVRRKKNDPLHLRATWFLVCSSPYDE